VFTVGFNKYGQLGVANSLFAHAEEPIEVFTDNLKIKKISSGWHHNLMLGEDGNLYGFGARLNG
jgi:alpha-tubulin suppressor-like RCC1 family protein